jgi:hypothetical protein
MHLTAHWSPTLKSSKETLWSVGYFWDTSVCFYRCLDVKLCLIQEKHNFTLRNLVPKSGNCVHHWLLCFQFVGKGSFVALTAYTCSFTGYVAMWAKAFDTPLWRANRDKFLGLSSIQVEMPLSFLQWKHDIYVFPLRSILILSLKIFWIIFHIVLLHGAFGMFFFTKSSVMVFCNRYMKKCCQWSHFSGTFTNVLKQPALYD